MKRNEEKRGKTKKFAWLCHRRGSYQRDFEIMTFVMFLRHSPYLLPLKPERSVSLSFILLEKSKNKKVVLLGV